ncbi:unnamed protein product [Acanthoscelides obtectus]|uniref:Uncharacterized protein n=1 Tax=Acanthoscelides obtectus TaxID=200917 RepID=A0A9P0LKF5_ACAOB|nr:unnamed protein product [Acanthoscelides obtectus]CAK1645830.1 hypothetical protein AOBTE_LOCUS14299 [Acanthoscelides obtectus]
MLQSMQEIEGSSPNIICLRFPICFSVNIAFQKIYVKKFGKNEIFSYVLLFAHLLLIYLLKFILFSLNK